MMTEVSAAPRPVQPLVRRADGRTAMLGTCATRDCAVVERPAMTRNIRECQGLLVQRPNVLPPQTVTAEATLVCLWSALDYSCCIARRARPGTLRLNWHESL
jgi:hypothetical protein